MKKFIKDWNRRRFSNLFLVFFCCVILEGCGNSGQVYLTDTQEKDGSSSAGSAENEDGSRKDQAGGTENSREDAGEASQKEHEGHGAGEEEGEKPQKLSVYVCGAVKTPGVYELTEGDRIGDAVKAAGGMKKNASSDAWNLAAPLTDGQMIRVPTEKEVSASSAGGGAASAGSGSGSGAGGAGTTGQSGGAGGAGTTGQSGGAGGAGTAGQSGGAGSAGTAGQSGGAGSGSGGGAGSAGTAGQSGGAGSGGSGAGESGNGGGSAAGGPGGSNVSDKININAADSQELQKIPGVGAARAEAIIKYRTSQGQFSKIEDVMKVSGIGEGIFSRMKEYIMV